MDSLKDSLRCEMSSFACCSLLFDHLSLVFSISQPKERPKHVFSITIWHFLHVVVPHYPLAEWANNHLPFSFRRIFFRHYLRCAENVLLLLCTRMGASRIPVFGSFLERKLNISPPSVYRIIQRSKGVWKDGFVYPKSNLQNRRKIIHLH